MDSLPIDSVLGDVILAVREAGSAVLIAPPGAGKTTRVPPAVLAEVDRRSPDGPDDPNDRGRGSRRGRDIIVVQPRRLAARLAAARVAAERGEPLGQTVGYEIRFDRRVGPRTRIRFVTEGVLTRRLLADPSLPGVAAVIIDEFHERHLAGDLALAMLARLMRGPRPDLRLVVMSATLDPEPVQRFLGGCPVIESTGRQFPVSLEYAPDRRGLPLDKQVSAAVRARTRAGDSAGGGGDVLVFLPGAAEIRRAADACADLARQRELLITPLHGDLPPEDQDRAVRSGPRRKIILATNVAETSVTIAGVTCVVDSGLVRVARHSPWSGMPQLRVEPISQASAAQRAGRAGR
ncbi:MAG: helicase-related protein, partial [Myxococcota bacterium]